MKTESAKQSDEPASRNYLLGRAFLARVNDGLEEGGKAARSSVKLKRASAMGIKNIKIYKDGLMVWP